MRVAGNIIDVGGGHSSHSAITAGLKTDIVIFKHVNSDFHYCKTRKVEIEGENSVQCQVM